MSKVLTTPPAGRDVTDAPRRFPVASFRALGDDAEPGTFQAIVAVFDNIDSYGDRIRRGFFEETLQAPPVGRGFPAIVWSHQWDVPPIGVSKQAREVEGREADELAGKSLGISGGLFIEGRYLVAEGEDHQVARQVYAASRATGGDGLPALREFSFGFRTLRSQWVEEDVDEVPESAPWDGIVRDLLKGELYEAGPTLVGANDRTALLDLKSAVAFAERHGGLSSDAASNMLRAMGDNTEPNSATGRKRRQVMDEEVRSRIAAAAELPPPAHL